MTAFFSSPSHSETKIVIVGGGLGGLSTAYHLRQEGFVCDVYEARSRLGGRVMSGYLLGETIELGGQNITDGGESFYIRQLIDAMGLETETRKVTHEFSYFTGERWATFNELIEKNREALTNLRPKLSSLAAKADNMGDVLRGILDESNPLYDLVALRLAGYEGGAVEKLSPLYAETLYHLLSGGVSSTHPGLEEDENLIQLESIKGGNALLAERLGQTLKDHLHLHHTLQRVNKGKKGGYKLHFKNGIAVECDILILAIPCTVYEDIEFEQGVIPEEQLKRIKNVSYGTNAKIIVPFPKPSRERMGFLNERAGAFFGTNPNQFILYYADDSGRFSPDTLQKTYKREWEMITKGLKGEYPFDPVPVYAEDKNFVDYPHPVGYSWSNDPYAKGSYSYIAPGQEELLTKTKGCLGERVRVLFEPVNRTLYFVGEHASILIDGAGTMEAACESGARTARILKQSYQ